MATPNWDQMHLLFMAGARDIATNAQTAGADLSVADRDFYLNQGFAKYVLLAYDIYQNDKDLLRSLLQSFINSSPLTVASGASVATANTTGIADYGVGLDVAALAPNTSVIIKSLEDFIQIQAATSLEIVPTLASIFATIQDTQIQFLPASLSGTGFIVTYLIRPFTIVENGATDCPLRSEHFDPIVNFALWHFYKNKQEFEIAQTYLTDGYKTSPFPLDLLQRVGATAQ